MYLFTAFSWFFLSLIGLNFYSHYFPTTGEKTSLALCAPLVIAQLGREEARALLACSSELPRSTRCPPSLQSCPLCLFLVLFAGLSTAVPPLLLLPAFSFLDSKLSSWNLGNSPQGADLGGCGDKDLQGSCFCF